SARPSAFGVHVIIATPQAFAVVEVEVEGKGRAVGATAEFLVPKWFDKRPHLTPAETVEELRCSLLIARELYLEHREFDTAFGLHAACIARQVKHCGKEGIPPLPPPYAPPHIAQPILHPLPPPP